MFFFFFILLMTTLKLKINSVCRERESCQKGVKRVVMNLALHHLILTCASASHVLKKIIYI